MSTPEFAPQPRPLVTDVAEALAETEKSQQPTGHFPEAEARDRARRVLSGLSSLDEARTELAAKYRNG